MCAIKATNPFVNLLKKKINRVFFTDTAKKQTQKDNLFKKKNKLGLIVCYFPLSDQQV